MKSEFLNVARRLMETERRPLSPRELVHLGLERQLFLGQDRRENSSPDDES